MVDIFRGGRGKRAPYQTEMRRIPSPLRRIVDRLSEEYKSIVQEYYDPADEELLVRVSCVISGLDKENAELRSQLNDMAAKVGDLKEKGKAAETELNQLYSQPPSSASGCAEAISILKEGMGLKANAGGAIKRKIEQALALLNT